MPNAPTRLAKPFTQEQLARCIAESVQHGDDGQRDNVVALRWRMITPTYDPEKKRNGAVSSALTFRACVAPGVGTAQALQENGRYPRQRGGGGCDAAGGRPETTGSGPLGKHS